ncbi:sugar transferase [Sporosarcina sp. FA9]|uniref:sugar transferase n=1 Tax=Sporosarcina sp. FA9 TaxID=3413030 RepID=UPI003F658676
MNSLFEVWTSLFLIIIRKPLILLFAFDNYLYSRRHIFFSQIRTGNNNIIFTIQEFRTLKLDMKKKKTHIYKV